MLDHALLDAIGILRESLETALLERHAFEERFQVDVLLGDMSWETSYTLPGEDELPRVAAEIAFEWPTWSQTAYRSLCIGEEAGDPPEIDIEVTLRLQRLAARPDPVLVGAALPDVGPELSGEAMHRHPPVVEEHSASDDVEGFFAVEVSYDGLYRVEPDALEEGTALEGLRVLGGWIASTLVRLADLDLAFLPPPLL